MEASPITDKETVWKIKSETLIMRRRPLVMGILNVTPDSFYDGGKYYSASLAIEHGLQLEQEGSDILDVGGLSTRPGSSPVPWEEEAQRVVSVITQLAAQIKIPISIDTYHAPVARAALEAGAQIVNDVGALGLDPEMAKMIREYGAGVILMHMRGEPLTMQRDTHYESLMEEIFDYLKNRITFAKSQGIFEEQIMIDPGLGFGKSAEQNLEIMRNLAYLLKLRRPILVGPSRKSFMGHILNNSVQERLSGTLACIAVLLRHGVSMVRVHDVRETVDFIKMWGVLEGKYFSNPEKEFRD